MDIHNVMHRRRFDYLDHNEGSGLETNVCETEVGLQPM